MVSPLLVLLFEIGKATKLKPPIFMVLEFLRGLAPAAKAGSRNWPVLTASQANAQAWLHRADMRLSGLEVPSLCLSIQRLVWRSSFGTLETWTFRCFNSPRVQNADESS